MKKKYFFVVIVAILMIGCDVEYSPNNIEPGEESTLQEVFFDTVANMPVAANLEFSNDNAVSISATYGEDTNIYYQIILIKNNSVEPDKILNDYLLPKFAMFDNVKTNKDNFLAFVRNDTIEMSAWATGKCVFFMKTDVDLVEQAVSGCRYLDLK